MERKEILHRIVEAERQAKSLVSEAEARRDGFSRYLEEKTAELRREHLECAERRIAEFDLAARASSDGLIAELDLKTERDLNGIHSEFEANREVWAQDLFNTAIWEDLR